MGILANPACALSSSRSSIAPVSPIPPAAPCKPKRRTHKSGNSSVKSVSFTGESYWRSKAPELVSLEVASQTPSIIKRGFEYMYHKSHGYRLTGGSFYFRPVSNLVRRSQRDAPPRGVIPTCPDPDGILPSPPPVASISFGPRKKHDSTIVVNVCSESAKKILGAASLISLEEAKQREVSRRNRAAKHASEKDTQVEREVRRLKCEVAEIAWKKAQAKHEEALEKQKQEEGPTLTAAVAAREEGLVVAPTNWIVPLISLDEARYTEKAKRDAADKFKPPLPRSLPPPSAVSSVDSLMINAGNGNTTTLQLIGLEEAAKRDRARRLEEDAIRSRTRMLAHAGTGLSHVPLITLIEARKQDVLRRKNGGSQDGNKAKSPNKSRKSSRPPPSSPANRAIETGDRDGLASPKDAADPREKARWLALMSNTGNPWTASHHSGPTIARTPTVTSEWV